MKNTLYIKHVLIILSLLCTGGCSLELKPPSLDRGTEEIDLISAEEIVPVFNYIEKAMTKQKSFKQLSSFDELDIFLINNSLTRSESVLNKFTQTKQSAKIDRIPNRDEGSSIVKKDGAYVYVHSGSKILIIDSSVPKDASIISEINLQSKISEFFISTERVVVVYDALEKTNEKNKKDFVVEVFDISDHLNPKIKSSLVLGGEYYYARLIKNSFFIVSSKDISNSFDAIFPSIKIDDDIVNCQKGSDCDFPNLFTIDSSIKQKTITAFYYFDTNKKISLSDSVYYILPNKYSMNVNKNIYLHYPVSFDLNFIETDILYDLIQHQLNNENKKQILNIQNAEEYLLSFEEKYKKIKILLDNFIKGLDKGLAAQIYAKVDMLVSETILEHQGTLNKTLFHKISMNANGFKNIANGEIDGVILDNTLFREYTNNIILVSSDIDSVAINKNNLYSLDRNLNIQGVVKDFSSSYTLDSFENISSRLYFSVENEEIDYIVVDVQKFNDMQLLGNIDLPEYDANVYPYVDNLLFGIKKASDDEGAVQVSLIDAHSIDNISNLNTIDLGGEGSNSIAIDSAKALLLSANKHMLVLPVNIKNPKSSIFAGNNFDGAVVLSVDNLTMKLKGLLEHSDLKTDEADITVYKNNHIKRSVYFGDILYTFSDYGIKLSSVKGLNTIQTIKFDNK